MSAYKDFSSNQYKEIDPGEIKDRDIFICRTKDYDNPFEFWDFAVARKLDNRVNIFGLFKSIHHAKLFAKSI